MNGSQNGPGVQWLAQRTGRSAEELLANHGALLDALAAAGRDATSLVLRLGSNDPATRTEAEVEARTLRAWFAVHQDPTAPTPGERFGQRLTQVLLEAAAQIRGGSPQAREQPK
jgi:streptomycin 6-kinase